MKIQYLLVKQKNNSCKTVDEFRNLLLSDDQLLIENNTIHLGKASFSFKLEKHDIDNNKKEIAFCFTVYNNGENENSAKALEALDTFINRLNENYGCLFKITTSWDGITVYYAKKLFPYIATVENLLREIIYTFMIKAVGSKWFNKTAPNKVRDNINKKTKRLEPSTEIDTDDPKKEIHNVLNTADFSMLTAFLFTKYNAKNKAGLTKETIKEIDEQFGDTIDKTAVIQLLNDYIIKSNWERYFSDKVKLEDPYQKLSDFYCYRCDIVHTRKIRRDEYKKALNLSKELIDVFDQCIDSIDEVQLSKEDYYSLKIFANAISGYNSLCHIGSSFEEAIDTWKNINIDPTIIDNMKSTLQAFATIANRVYNDDNFTCLDKTK